MDVLPSELRDLRILRRLLFGVAYLPKDLPNYWSVLSTFITQGTAIESLSLTVLRTAVENLQFLNEKAFVTDNQLAKEFHSLTFSTDSKSKLGIALISSKTRCKKCNNDLLVRSDRPSHITVYTETYGTVVGTHFRKFCKNFRKGCSYTQHYGYYTDGSQSATYYDKDWNTNQYFLSTSETAFEMTFLSKYDGELLLGQISYSQKADIFNHQNGYPVLPKSCSTLDRDELPSPPVK